MAKHIKTIRAGRLVKTALYTTGSRKDSPQQRAAKHRATTEAQKKVNMKNAAENLEFRIACNFGSRDIFVTLTYDTEHLPRNHAAAVKNMNRFTKTLRSVYKRNRAEFKYIYTVEGHDKEGRIHHHALISTIGKGARLDRDTMESLWGNGFVEVESLEKYYNHEAGHIDYAGISGYMVKEGHEERLPVGAQKFICSRNLAKPEITVETLPDGATLDPPIGVHIIEAHEEKNILAEWKYYKYILPEPPKRPTGRPAKVNTDPADFYLRGEY